VRFLSVTRFLRGASLSVVVGIVCIVVVIKAGENHRPDESDESNN